MNDLKRPSIKTSRTCGTRWRRSSRAATTRTFASGPDSEFYQTFCSECFLKWVDQADPKDPKTRLLEDILYVNEHLLEARCATARSSTPTPCRGGRGLAKLIAAFPNLFEWLVTDPSEAQIADFNALIEKLARLRRHYGMGSTASVDRTGPSSTTAARRGVRLGQSMDPLDGGENVLEHFARTRTATRGPR
ncbi:hypothetical protein JL720_16809 [Aureococcus anophagefferens]|nr:hypothetical protein JL720_16809 [Aureococcus anophagefferens]